MTLSCATCGRWYDGPRCAYCPPPPRPRRTGSKLADPRMWDATSGEAPPPRAPEPVQLVAPREQKGPRLANPDVWAPPPPPRPPVPSRPASPVAGPVGYGYPAPRTTNTLAILSLVFAFLFPLLGIIFGAVGLQQIRQRHEDGRGLALAGIIISSISIALVLLLILVAVVAASSVGATG